MGKGSWIGGERKTSERWNPERKGQTGGSVEASSSLERVWETIERGGCGSKDKGGAAERSWKEENWGWGKRIRG